MLKKLYGPMAAGVAALVGITAMTNSAAADGVIGVSVEVVQSATTCTFAASQNIAFGAIGTTTPATPPATGQGKITFTCDGDENIRLDMVDGGLQRTLIDPTTATNDLNYNLLKPVDDSATAAASAAIWGIGATDGFSTSVTANAPKSLNVHAALAAGQTASVATYSENVTVTIFISA